MAFGLRLSSAVFNAVHRRHLIYNACWEDPRIDRLALRLGPDDTVMVITSAGCNALDYALTGPRHVYAVDMNPRQNALLELKMAGIRELPYADFFQLFGRGRHPEFAGLYHTCLRPRLSRSSASFWDHYGDLFLGRGGRDSFYFRGTSGFVAYLVNVYINRIARLREAVDAILCSASLAEQRTLYYEHLHEQFWRSWLRWLVGREATMYLLGVPRAQIQQIERHYSRGVVAFVQECLEAVFACLPLQDNYFWRVYLTGSYTEECCPEYLTRAGFEALKGGLIERVSAHTCTVQHFLENHDGEITRFVLLDHMDWLSSVGRPLLAQEWQAIVDRAARGARVIWRSGGLDVDYVDPLTVTLGGRRCRVGELLHYHPELAADLHQRDRVHTYGNFYIADVQTV